MGVELVITQVLEDFKERGLKTVSWIRVVTEVVKAGYSMSTVYNKLREMEAKGKIKTVKNTRAKYIILSGQ